MDAIANHLWQSTTCAGLIAIFGLVLKSNRASTRFWLWLIASLKFLVPFGALMAIGRLLPSGFSDPTFDSRATAFVNALFPSSAAEAVDRPYQILLLIVWLTGALLVIAGWCWRWRKLSAVARAAKPLSGGREDEILRRLERTIGVARPLKLAATDSPLEPGVIGIRKPVLLWPRQMSARLSAAQIEMIVAHELFHVHRRDNLWASLHMLVSAAFWFHPLVWWLGGRLVEERERACDESVLALGNQPEAYAQSIVKTCEFTLTLPLVNVAGVTGSDLKKRITRIMRNSPRSQLEFWKKMSLAATGIVAVFLPLSLGVFVGAETPSTSAPTASAAQDAYPLGNRVETPRLVREVKPEYTPRAMEAKIQGMVMMECVVEPDGTVGRIAVVQSLDPDLDQEAIDAVQQWLFDPGTKDGEPVPVIVTIQIAFTLK